MRRAFGLQARVTLASVLALAVGLGVFSVVVNLVLANRLEQDASAVLRARTDAQLATIAVQNGRIVVRDGTQDDVLDRQAWVYAAGRTLVRPAAAADVQRASDALATVTTPVERDVSHAVRLRAEPAYDAGRRRQVATVVVGISRDPYEHTERIALLGTLALDLFVLLAGAGIAWRAVGAALRPVADMARDAEDWGEHDLDRRFGLGPARDELTGLAATLDGLLGRIAASRRHEQRFSAEVAHELRTPLAGIQAEAELAAQHARGNATTQASLAAIVGGTERMAGVIDTLLAVARGEAGGEEGCDARAVMTGALAAVMPAAAARGVTITAIDPAAGPLRVAADEDVLARALAPLLENAVRHARGVVSASFERGAGVVRLVVRDDGPGVATADAERIFEPGYRSGTAGADGGAGLGLALARRLAQGCGGNVTARAGDDGVFVLELPG